MKRKELRSAISRVGCLLLIIVVVAATLANVAVAENAGLYGQHIVLRKDASKAAVRTADDLRKWLGRITGQLFDVSDQQQPTGIFLVTDSSPLLPQTNLGDLRAATSPEAFLIYGDASQLWIVGKSDLAVDRGVYWYLDKLGCRWLLPSQRWTIIPKRTDISLAINTLQSPAFDLRDFAGTGHFGRPAIDPQQRMAAAWEEYQRQNLLGGSLRLGGHAGEAFALKYQNVWREHPEYLAENNSRRQTWTPTAIVKLCSSNPGLQALWVQDRADYLRTHLERDPAVRTVSVEPSDGGGHCECAECRKLGSVSDQVFTLANLVAREVQRQLPGKFVNLYAYNEHAAPPAIDVEPNVIVSIVPYGFQRTGMTPEEFILAWERKCTTLAMYESNMLQVFRLAQLIGRDERPALDDINPDNPMWKDIQQLSDAEILRLVDAGIEKYQPLDIQLRSYSATLIPLSDPPAPPDTSVQTEQKEVTTGQFGYSAEFKFAPPAAATRVRIQLRVGSVSGPGKYDRVRVTDPQGSVVFDARIDNTGEWRDLDIPTGARGTYTLSVGDQKNTFWLRVSAHVPFVCSSAYTCTDLSPRSYFFVPRGLTKIAMHSPGVIPIKLFDPDGKPVTVDRNEHGKNVFLIDVAPGQDGRIWSFSRFKSWQPFRLLNCPNLFAFSPTGLLVPQEVLERSTK